MLERLRHLPSAWIVGACVAVAIVAEAVLPDGPALGAELACLAVVAAYCALRPADGLTVLGLAILPAAGGAIIGDGFGIPRWTVALPLAGVTLLFLLAQDREDRARRAAPSTAATAAD